MTWNAVALRVLAVALFPAVAYGSAPTWGFSIAFPKGPPSRVGSIKDKTTCEGVRSILAEQHPDWVLSPACEPDPWH